MLSPFTGMPFSASRRCFDYFRCLSDMLFRRLIIAMRADAQNTRYTLGVYRYCHYDRLYALSHIFFFSFFDIYRHHTITSGNRYYSRPRITDTLMMLHIIFYAPTPSPLRFDIADKIPPSGSSVHSPPPAFQRMTYAFAAMIFFFFSHASPAPPRYRLLLSFLRLGRRLLPSPSSSFSYY